MSSTPAIGISQLSLDQTIKSVGMRQTPPTGFEVARFFEGIYTFQRWEIFPGIFTTGPKDVGFTMDRLGIPKSLQGKRVLDIAPWNGFFSFECARRGAAEIVSLGPEDPDLSGYNRTRELLEIDNCHYVRGSVYDLAANTQGKFDVVLFLGVIYHLRHPLLALDTIYDITSQDLYVDTPIIDNFIFDTNISEETKNRILASTRDIHTLPLVYFTKGDETGDPCNWFVPNLRGFHDLVESSGFRIVHVEEDDGAWAWLSATKGERNFAIGLEGYNPAVTSTNVAGPSPVAVSASRPALVAGPRDLDWARQQGAKWYDAAIIAAAECMLSELSPRQQYWWKKTRKLHAAMWNSLSYIYGWKQRPTTLELADRARNEQQWERAARFYLDALIEDPRNSAIWLRLGDVLAHTGKQNEATLAHLKAAQLAGTAVF